MILTQLIIGSTIRNTFGTAGMNHCSRSSSRIWQNEIRDQLRKQCSSWCEMLAVARELRRSGDLSRREKRPAYSLANMPTAYAEAQEAERWDGLS